ncbi:MAG: tetratricopeptide repeat protein [Desulfobacterota bacterium]|nr:tetratricopeptide repeat protein [Thermodesulfobacteriota bacterium]
MGLTPQIFPFSWQIVFKSFPLFERFLELLKYLKETKWQKYCHKVWKNKVNFLRKHQIIEVMTFSIIIFLLVIGTYLRNEIWNSEIELWEDCIKKSIYKSRPYVNLGFAYYEIGNYEKAFEITQKAIALNPKNAEAHHNLGIIMQKMGDLTKAAEKVIESLRIDPELHMALYSLGSIYLEGGHLEES